jgi:hypothetical protein
LRHRISSHRVLAERHRPLDADVPATEAIPLAVELVHEALAAADVSSDANDPGEPEYVEAVRLTLGGSDHPAWRFRDVVTASA